MRRRNSTYRNNLRGKNVESANCLGQVYEPQANISLLQISLAGSAGEEQ